MSGLSNYSTRRVFAVSIVCGGSARVEQVEAYDETDAAERVQRDCNWCARVMGVRFVGNARR